MDCCFTSLLSLTLASILLLSKIFPYLFSLSRSLLLKNGLLHKAALAASSTSCPVVAFFHPYCNAGGGGERVLWCAIRAVQREHPGAVCVVYTGDVGFTGAEILSKAKMSFGISLERDCKFVFLKNRRFVEASTYPVLTLLGQSLGSLFLAYEALQNLVPDIYIDTMGYPFTYPLFRLLGLAKVACYIHYPTISTDMLASVQTRAGGVHNAALIRRSAVLSALKVVYYRLFARIYGIVGSFSQVSLVNSTWTMQHIAALWKAPATTFLCYPPCNTLALKSLPLEHRQPLIVSLAQFRPEKDHALQISAFAHFLEKHPSFRPTAKLVLIGGCRGPLDLQRVDDLKGLVHRLHLQDSVEFRVNLPYEALTQVLASAIIGIHTMWNEHFGIGIVEYMAAGLIPLAHNSGGPALDIVRDGCGFLAGNLEEYSQKIYEILSLSDAEKLLIQKNARDSCGRFSEQNFEHVFLQSVKTLFSF